jgi:superfamily II DNA/RNA helicase
MSYAYRSKRAPFSGGGNSRRSYQSRPNRGNNRGEYIDPSRFVKEAQVVNEEKYVPTHSFEDFNIHQILKTNLAKKGYETPSPIQDQTIPTALEGRDIIGIASTGTGKTASFGIPVLNKLIENPKSYALVIAPTRELAQQIESELKEIARGSGLHGALLIGGSSMRNQLMDLRDKPRIVIGTPGRIKDHLHRRTLVLDNFDMIVLDEVDRMLDMGFVNDVTTILNSTKSDRQSFFFSATIEHKVRALIDNFTNDPITVSLKASSASQNVHQNVVRFRDKNDKMTKLNDILSKEDVSKVIVFDETQRGVERLYEELYKRGYATDSIHGGKSQGQRQRALAKFKQNEVRILVATDVAARGIDVSDITHVINYSIPKVYDDYIHRIGRTGRAGRIGHALTFIEG